MTTGAMIVSIITVLACLILATRSSALGQLALPRVIKLALIWTGIIVGLMLAIQILGLRVAS